MSGLWRSGRLKIRVRTMLKRINDVLPELILEIFLYGLLVQLTGVWFVENKLLYSTGLWIGIAAAMGMAIHMAVVILDTMDLAIEKQAKVRTTVFSMLRYLVVVLLFVVVSYFRLGNVLTMFIGIMGLKAAAYFQPFMHRLLKKTKERGSDGSTELVDECEE